MKTIFRFACIFSIILALGSYSASGENWPSYLKDNARSGISADTFQTPLKSNWIFQSPNQPNPAWPAPAPRDFWHKIREIRPLVTYDRAFQTVAVDGTVYFGSSADDKVYALNQETGKVRWTFFTGGPVRLAPTIYKNKVYFGSDDGYAYCLNCKDGSLVWKTRPVPIDHRQPGNGRMISLWPIRTGITIYDNTAYCFAGLFPVQGVFLCALDVEDGSILMKKQVEEEGVSPSGYLLASQDRIITPTGRTTPAFFNRRDGSFMGYFDDLGGAFALLSEDDSVFHESGRNTNQISLSDLKTKERIATFDGLRIIVDGDMAYLMSKTQIYSINRTRYIDLSKQKNALSKRANEIGELLKKARRSQSNINAEELTSELRAGKVKIAEIDKDMKGCVRWSRIGSFPYVMIKSANLLFAGGDDIVSAFDTETGEEVWTDTVIGRVYGLTVANGNLIVSTDKGFIYSYSNRSQRQGVVVSYTDDDPYPQDEYSEIYSTVAQRIIEESGVDKGYCLILGCKTGRLAYEIAKRTELRVIGLSDNADDVALARDKLDKAGWYGNRIEIHHGSLENPPYVQYFANLIISESAIFSGKITTPVDQVYRMLRPCGGFACLGQLDDSAQQDFAYNPSAIRNWFSSAENSGWNTIEDNGTWAAYRRGVVPGSGEWTHLYAEPGNSVCSQDAVYGKMGIQWYGQPGPRYIIDRHNRPMSPLFKNGRLFVNASDRIIAVDAYNGAYLWELEVPMSRRIGALKDCGQTTVADDYVYIAAKNECHAIDVESGKIKFSMKVPPSDKNETLDWGYNALVGDQIFGSGTKVGASFYEISENSCNLLEGDFREMILCDILFSLDRYTGETLWTYEDGVIFNNTITIGDGKFFFVVSHNEETVSDPDGRISPHKFCASQTTLIALDMKTGKVVWETPYDFPFQQIMYLCFSDGKVIVSGSYNIDKNVHYGLYAFSSADGDFQWNNSYKGDSIGGEHGEQWQHPVIIGDTVYNRPYAFDLHSGEKKLYELDRGGHGCGGLSASASNMFGRGRHPRMYEIEGEKESGTALTLVNRPGCWINIIPVGGLILLPESSSGCTCNFPMQMSVAFSPLEVQLN